MSIEPVDLMAAPAETAAAHAAALHTAAAHAAAAHSAAAHASAGETATDAAVAQEEAAAQGVIAPLGTVTETPEQLADESISELEAQAYNGDQGAIRELALRAKLTEVHVAEHKAATTVEPLPVAHSPAEPGKGTQLDESA